MMPTVPLLELQKLPVSRVERSGEVSMHVQPHFFHHKDVIAYFFATESRRRHASADSSKQQSPSTITKRQLTLYLSLNHNSVRSS